MLKPHLRKVKEELRKAVNAGLTAAGSSAVASVRREMQSGYGKPIRQSGKLYDSISFRAEDGILSVGSDLPYAALVHEGTSSMPGRPFLLEGMQNAAGTMADIMQQKMKE